ncbi:carbohydrate kinase family protein, partial [Patescibacteria group bacterium]|nr:carbohydrate kinase family protein [Patescibacteria group bacterium]
MKKNVFVTGSLAYDHISNFHDKFSNHILPNKIHVLNVSFTTSNLKKQFGGTATNIAYNLKMLGLEPNIFSAAGKDFAEYQAWLNKHRIKTNYITKVKDDFTAVANIITDEDDNQINSFYSGALGKKRPSIKTALKKEKPVLGIISPDNPVMMISYAQDFTFAKLPFI